ELIHLETMFVFSDATLDAAPQPGGKTHADTDLGCGQSRWAYLPFSALQHPDDSPLPAAVEYWDPMAIFYTSGTTGPSKGVLYSYGQAHATATPPAKLCDPKDVFYMTLPMFHVGLSHIFGIVIINGATM